MGASIDVDEPPGTMLLDCEPTAVPPTNVQGSVPIHDPAEILASVVGDRTSDIVVTDANDFINKHTGCGIARFEPFDCSVTFPPFLLGFIKPGARSPHSVRGYLFVTVSVVTHARIFQRIPTGLNPAFNAQGKAAHMLLQLVRGRKLRCGLDFAS